MPESNDINDFPNFKSLEKEQFYPVYKKFTDIKICILSKSPAKGVCMSKFTPPDLENLPNIINPDNIPGINYYLEVWQQPDSGYPKCPNHSHELTTKDFVEVANATVEAFGKAWKKSKEYDHAY